MIGMTRCTASPDADLVLTFSRLLSCKVQLVILYSCYRV